MNLYTMAEDYLNRANRCLHEAKDAQNVGDYPMTVRRSQECIELSVKGILRGFGIEFPREHDVSDVLLDLGQSNLEIPFWFVEKINNIARIMREITPKRGPAMYGLEREMKPASELFSKEDGEKALDDAVFVFNNCKRVFEEWRKG
jgi:HEPN domain-containing protein